MEISRSKEPRLRSLADTVYRKDTRQPRLLHVAPRAQTRKEYRSLEDHLKGLREQAGQDRSSSDFHSISSEEEAESQPRRSRRGRRTEDDIASQTGGDGGRTRRSSSRRWCPSATGELRRRSCPRIKSGIKVTRVDSPASRSLAPPFFQRRARVLLRR